MDSYALFGLLLTVLPPALCLCAFLLRRRHLLAACYALVSASIALLSLFGYVMVFATLLAMNGGRTPIVELMTDADTLAFPAMIALDVLILVVDACLIHSVLRAAKTLRTGSPPSP